MTRARDIFISLDGRLKRSRTLAADLFISLHADSIAQNADSVRGATVYTLSERASDEEARLMAEKENNSDAIAGLTTAKFEEQGQVRSILIDLLKRETANFSADFSNTLVKKMTKTVSLSRDPQRSAAFKVLRQADTPSVLIELGYMSHAEDEKLLNSPAWQDRVATSIATAVDAYFGKRTAGAR
jgi:N-acetylmuramoyl-L-alanine amidase